MDFLNDIMLQCANALDRPASGFMGLMLAGFIGGLMHCSLMCGPVALALGVGRKLGLAEELAYHGGRISTYIILALFFSLAAEFVMAWLPLKTLLIAPALMLAAFLLVGSVWSQSAFFASFNRLISYLPTAGLAQLLMRAAASMSLAKRAYLTGIATGFMPCGMTLSVLLAAAVLVPAEQAVLSLTAFGLGTSAALLVIARGLRPVLYRLRPSLKTGFAALTAIWLVGIAGWTLQSAP